MPRVIHVVISSTPFGGVERYVCDVAAETASLGWEVAVVGGDPDRMRAALGSRMRWEPGSTPLESLRSVLRLGRCDVIHAHMTKAEAIAVATRRVHHAPVVSTRHFAAVRGASRVGRVVAPWIAKGLAGEIAPSEFIARHLERPPAAIVPSGVPQSPNLWSTENRVVLVLQRLAVEKDTVTALQAWRLSQLVGDGWSLRIVGEGSEQPELERVVASEEIGGVTFAGWTDTVANELRSAGILLASAPSEPFGLAVLEAMAAGIPVLACACGGHLETVGLVEGAAMYPPGDAAAAATALRSLLSDSKRARLSAEGQRIVAERFTIKQHVDRLLAQYEAVQGEATVRRDNAVPARLL